MLKNMLTQLNALGLATDLCGALILVFGALVSRDHDLSHQAQAGVIGPRNPRLLKSLCEQRNDARVGFGLIGLGVVLQIISLTFPNLPMWAGFLTQLILLHTLTIYLSNRTRWTHHSVRKICNGCASTLQGSAIS
jgi:hypothetical protein